MSKLLNSVRLALDMDLTDVFAWCDSTIVLHWLNGNPRKFKTFVGNRISNILTLLPANAWNHVPTKLIPQTVPLEAFLPESYLDLLYGGMAHCGCKLSQFNGLLNLSLLHLFNQNSRLTFMWPLPLLSNGLRGNLATISNLYVSMLGFIASFPS